MKILPVNTINLQQSKKANNSENFLEHSEQKATVLPKAVEIKQIRPDLEEYKLTNGLKVKSIKTSKDLMEGANYYLKGFSSLIVLIFFAAQFCLIFKETNIGIFIVASLAELLDNLQLTGFVLILFSFLYMFFVFLDLFSNDANVSLYICLRIFKLYNIDIYFSSYIFVTSLL
mgnify:CR=1 FL=1